MQANRGSLAGEATVPLNGAASLVRTLIDGDMEVCFANPATSDMYFVPTLDRVEGMRAVPFLFEGGATGAADRYGRMKDRPVSTLLHLGPGFANGMANLHNARRARSPIVNVASRSARR
jgi:acetolactate synthase-1/2/3 large subunit